MEQQESTDRDLETLARSAALSLGVPFVTVAVGGDAHGHAPFAAKGVFADADWIAEHGDIDLIGLDNASAVARNIPFYACIPVRNDSGESIGRVCCGSSEDRGLTDAEIGTLKAAASKVAALFEAKGASPAFVRV